MPSTICPTQYRADIVRLTQQPRPLQSAALREAQRYLEDELSDAGFDVESARYEYSLAPDPAQPQAGRRIVECHNVLAWRGDPSNPRGILMASAHYDTEDMTPGADDNTTGVAAVLGLARALKDFKCDKTLCLALWDGEETQYLGSLAEARTLKEQGCRIEHHFVFEMIGYTSTQPGSQSVPLSMAAMFPRAAFATWRDGRRGNFIANIGSDHTVLAELARYSEESNLPVRSLWTPPVMHSLAYRTSLSRSDHVAFWLHGFAATMLTDTAEMRSPHYRQLTDTVETLDIDFAVKVANSVLHYLQEHL